MKKIVLSLAVIAMTASVVVGVTVASFSDQGVVAGNTVATGTLALTLNESAGKPFSISGAYPGYMSGWEHIDIFNAPWPAVPGQLPFEAKLSFSKTGGSGPLWNKLVIELETAGGDGVCNTDDYAENVIWNGLIKNFPNGTVVSNIAYWHLANEDDASGPPDNIRAGYSERICQRVGVHSSAGNNVQGTSVTFNEVVDAVQDND